MKSPFTEIPFPELIRIEAVNPELKGQVIAYRYSPGQKWMTAIVKAVLENEIICTGTESADFSLSASQLMDGSVFIESFDSSISAITMESVLNISRLRPGQVIEIGQGIRGIITSVFPNGLQYLDTDGELSALTIEEIKSGSIKLYDQEGV